MTLKEQYNYPTTITTTAQCNEMDTGIAITIIITLILTLNILDLIGCMCGILYTVMTFDALDL